jgi:alpha-ribazole phosphatase
MEISKEYQSDKLIYLYRHPETILSNNYCYGNSDIDLSKNSLKQVKSISEKLSQLNPDIIFSSDLKRCKIISDNLNFITHFSKDLREINFGDWEMKKWDHINREDLDKWVKNFNEFIFPDGESYHLFQKRIKHFFKKRIIDSKAKTTLLISHAGVIREIMSIIYNCEYQKLFDTQIGYSSLYLINGDVISDLGCL